MEGEARQANDDLPESPFMAGQASRAASDELGQSPRHSSPPVPDLARKSNGSRRHRHPRPRPSASAALRLVREVAPPLLPRAALPLLRFLPAARVDLGSWLVQLPHICACQWNVVKLQCLYLCACCRRLINLLFPLPCTCIIDADGLR